MLKEGLNWIWLPRPLAIMRAAFFELEWVGFINLLQIQLCAKQET